MFILRVSVVVFVRTDELHFANGSTRRTEDEDGDDDNEAPVKEGKWRKHLNNLGLKKRKIC